MTTQTGEPRAATAPDGVPLSYETIGQGDAVVFVHGGFASRTAWRCQRDALAPSFRLILRDLRGHDGAPSAAPPDYGFDTTEAADMRAVLDAESIDRAHIVAHSTGGAIAFLFALRCPERVNRLVLIEPTLSSLLPADFMEARFAEQPRAFACIERDGPLPWLRLAMSGLAGPDWATRLSPRAVARVEAQAAIAAAHARAFAALTIGDEDLRALAAPTLFLYGDRSMDWEPLISERIGRIRPDIERRVIAGATHNVHLDQPEAVNAALIEFLGGSSMHNRDVLLAGTHTLAPAVGLPSPHC